MLLSPGDRVDRYEVLELLGSGGMGEVYRARDPKLARLVALKILRIERADGTDGAARLLREARAAAALAHPNVLAVYDVGEAQDGLAYIAMELVVGRTLRAYVGDTSIAMRQRIAWLRDVAAALEAAHRAGIVHRDVKPENVMVREDGVVKVLDFGIARRAATADEWSWTDVRAMSTGDTLPVNHLPTLTGQGTVVGTPLYMAPEQLRGETLDARVDQFAWGVVAYSLLTGRIPWGAGDSIALVSQILSHEPPAPAEVDVSVPPAVSNAIMRTLAKKRGERFASMADVLPILDEVATGATSTAMPRPRWPRRALVGALACAVLVAGGAGFASWRARRAGVANAKRAASEVHAPGCTTNAECVHAHGGEAWHCNSRRHECVAIASEDCKAYAEPHDAEQEDVVWIGGMYPVSQYPDDSERRAIELARLDFAHELGPSAARTGPLHARPIAVVICDEGVDEKRAARHLVEDVEVPAIIGFISAPGAVRAISTELLPHGVMSVLSLSQASELTRIPQPRDQPRLIWRTTLDHEAIARPVARLISDVIEPAARTGGLHERPLRVAVLMSNNVHPDVVESLLAALRFNGKTAVENRDNFRQFKLDANGGIDATVIQDLVSFAPHVLFFGEHAIQPILTVLDAIETSWRGGPRPVYVTTTAWTPGVDAFIGRDASRRRRFLAVTNYSSTLTNAQLVLHYNTMFPHEPVERSVAPQPSYDAFYLLAYATYALGDGVVTGTSLSSAFDRLMPPGQHVDVGPSAIYGAFGTLRAGGRIDLNGAIGSLDFDRTSGNAPIDYAVVCFDVDRRGAATVPIDSGLVYDARADRIVGTLRCP